MGKANKVLAFFFLGLFSIMLLHQAFPHIHHQHEDSHFHSKTTHSIEGHHHHDDGSKENEGSVFAFLDFFMDMHVHSTISSDIVILKRNTVEQQTLIDKDVVRCALDVQGRFLIDIRLNSKPPIYHPPNNYFNAYLSYLDLRGPPNLG